MTLNSCIFARFPLLFTRMKIQIVRTTAGVMRDQVVMGRSEIFLRRKDFMGSDRAVESALSRLTKAGELVRVRRGLYFRGKTTRFGMTRPSMLDTAIAVAGPGSGPSGIAAAHMLGLTTQVPSTTEVAVPGNAPESLRGVRFRSRSYSRRELKLRPLEVAVLEMLRDPTAAEVAWPDVKQRIVELIASKQVRSQFLAAQVTAERHPDARHRWASLTAAV